MAERAIILIPDISGYTEFTSSTEIDHAAHIMTELLELIVASNDTGFTLAEIEGDAVLFYRTGEPPGREPFIDQCLRMFARFHERLMVIERDTVCQCGACQTASGLTLKFIAHYGYIKEIRVAHFVKATGVDMIVAHRLLKNDVDSSEYILMSAPCCDAVGHVAADGALSWQKASSTYDAIGPIRYEYAPLTEYRSKIPAPPPRPRFVVEKGDDDLELGIDAPLRAVYQTLINVDKRPEWLAGVDTIEREATSERIGMRHNCVFMGMKLTNTALHAEYADDRAFYAERVEVPEVGLAIRVHYDMARAAGGGTRLGVNVNWLDSVLPPEMKQGMIEAEIANLELLKQACERNPA